MNVPGGWHEQFARALIDAELEVPEGIVGAGRGQRFAVYRGNVGNSIVDGLALAFPVTHALVGNNFFQAMARRYLRESPPRSPVMHEYGDGFPDFVSAFPPAQVLPFLGDVARLEAARVQCFHAADCTPLEASQLQALSHDPERVQELRLELAPAMRIVCSPFRIHSLWRAHEQGNGDLSGIEVGEREDVLVTRPLHEVQLTVLAPGAAYFIQALQQGRALGEAAQLGAQAPGFDLAGALAELLQRRLVTGVSG